MGQQAWRITLRQGKKERRYVVTEMIEVGDVCKIKGETGPWAVVKKEPTEILLVISASRRCARGTPTGGGAGVPKPLPRDRARRIDGEGLAGALRASHKVVVMVQAAVWGK